MVWKNEGMREKEPITILTPVFNDWDSLRMLMAEIGRLIPSSGRRFSLMIVDDASAAPVEANQLTGLTNGFDEVCVLRVAANLGHQRAIAVGLSAIESSGKKADVLIRDCDGEDKPSDIPSMLDASEQNPEAIVVAQRSQRSEGLVFRIFYSLYKMLFRAMTGRSIDFGNFCVIPSTYLKRMVYTPELWNHLPGSIMRSKCRIIKVPTARGKRYAGKSSMDLLSLITHGLSAMSVFADLLFIRLFVLTSVTSAFAVMGAIIIVLIRLLTDFAIPGWASTLVSLAFVVLIQSITLLMIGIFMMLSARSSPSFIPAVHAAAFISETWCASGSENQLGE
jgi:hypothetical protein